MKTLSIALMTFLAGTAVLAAAPKSTKTHQEIPENPPKNIVFIGDSITQGGKFLKGPVPSYRYQLFKNFVDNDLPFRPMGMTRSASGNVDVTALTPDYRGKTFENVSEAAASGRAYQYAGHENDPKQKYKGDPGTVFPPENRGPVTLKLGQQNKFVKGKGAKTDFYDGATLKTYAGDTYKKVYGNEKADTVCIMIGINDLYDEFQKDPQISTHVHNIVKAYQAYNPKIRVHVFELLPTAGNNGTGTNNKNNYNRYNAHLRSLNIEKKWSSKGSRVTLSRISQGFYDEDGSMCDGPTGAHPNAQGELIVAGNIARAIGVGQRTAGLERVPAKKMNEASVATSGKVSKSGNDYKFASPLAGTAEVTHNWPKSVKNCTVSFNVKMDAKKSDKNLLGVICGNGSGAGLLNIGEKAVYWNDQNNILYGTKDMAHGEEYFTQNEREIRIAYIASAADGVKAGFYVWLDDQLIGEALPANSSAAFAQHANKVLIGDLGGGVETFATISVPVVDDKAAVAPAARK